MKTFNILSLIFLTASISKAQLKNTKWQGVLKVPYETKVILHFKMDSVDMIIVDNEVVGEMVGETMSYSVKDSVITMKKISGHSPCNVGDEFKVTYSVKDQKLSISNLSDPCDARVQSWTKEPLTLVKQ